MIQLTKPVLIAGVAGVVAIGAIASAAWRLIESERPPVRPAVISAPDPAPVVPASPEKRLEAPPLAAAPPVAPPATAVASPPAAPPVAPAPLATPAAPAAPAAAPPPPAPLPVRPTFDVVRIEPSGEAVIAGRAAPGARVALVVSGRSVANAVADADGQFVLLPPRLPEGAHTLTLRAGDVESEQAVAVDVAPRAERAPVAALAAPGKPTVVLAAPGAADSARSAPTSLRIGSVEAHQGGAFFVSGFAPGGSDIRLYLNDSYVAAVTAGQDGAWSVRVERGMSPGAYRVRADVVGADGRPVSRVETPFDYPASIAADAPAPSAVAASGTVPPVPSGIKTPTQNAVVSELRTARVTRGDSLWRISRTIYGEGTRYTEIYDANSAQIRDPDLIYPGQVLVVPKQDQPPPLRR
jgi:nucleoid-associated protein YgaU